MRWPLSAAFAIACGPAAQPLTTFAPQAAMPGSWQAGTPLPGARFEGYAATLGSKVYYLGGITGTPGDPLSATPSHQVDVFDPAPWTERRWPSCFEAAPAISLRAASTLRPLPHTEPCS